MHESMRDVTSRLPLASFAFLYRVSPIECFGSSEFPKLCQSSESWDAYSFFSEAALSEFSRRVLIRCLFSLHGPCGFEPAEVFEGFIFINFQTFFGLFCGRSFLFLFVSSLGLLITVFFLIVFTLAVI